MWRNLTEDDLASRLSQDEIEAHSLSSAWTSNPVSQILSDVTEEVRGYIASGRKCQMGPEGTIPGMLVSAAISIAVVQIVSRNGMEPNETRRKALSDAYDTLNKISRGEIIPEDYGEAPKSTDKVATAPAFADPKPTRLLD